MPDTAAVLTAQDEPPVPGSRRRNAKSSNGCWTCKGKNVKCDEQRPVCNRCCRLNRVCDYTPRLRRPYPPRRTVPRAASESDEGHGLPCPTSDRCSSISPECLLHHSPTVLVNSPSPPNTMAPCSLILTADDHEAIHHFRTSLARRYHTKNPRYSVIAVIFLIASESPLVMHMVIAIAQCEMHFMQAGDQRRATMVCDASGHYAAALHMMVGCITCNDGRSSVDAILAATWLMICYERNFGDGDCKAILNHLNGITSIVYSGSCHMSPLVPTLCGLRALPLTPSSYPHSLSLFTARMLVWISILDASAVSCGLGSHFNASLHQIFETGLVSSSGVISPACDQPLQEYCQIQTYSNSLFCYVWREDYPPAELMDDLQNHEVFLLYGECTQLRHMVGRLSASRKQNRESFALHVSKLETLLQQVSRKYAETLELARRLTTGVDNSCRFIKNVRFVIPHYHAVTLFLIQLYEPRITDEHRPQLAVETIVNLAVQAFQCEGDEAMLRIAWPLFMAALITRDSIQRDWIQARLGGLAKFGQNYRRAVAFVDEVVAERDPSSSYLDAVELLQSGRFEKFVI